MELSPKKKKSLPGWTGIMKGNTLKNLMDKRKTASLSEAASSVATNSHLAGGVYRVSFSSLDARRSGGSQAPLGPDSLPPILAL